jgi:UDP-GlcNAc:undecaprenyl-phosphate/decaprenyl-phosphate GlcNAc-1-phosphate transferase
MTEIYLMTLFAALAGTAFFTPAAIWLSEKFGVMDQPDPRKVHDRPVPRWGGLGIFAGALFSLLLVWLAVPRFGQLLAFRHKLVQAGEVVGVLSLRDQFVGILVGASLVAALGMADDRKPVPALVKLLTQIIAAYIAMVYGVRVAGLALPGYGFVDFPLIVSQIFTLLWLLGFMNAINLADGLDGLAAGIVAVASATFLVVCVLQSQTQVLLFSKQLKLAAVLAAAVCGSAAGFLFYNFFPARVFMGDGGALFLGFMLGAISLIGTLKTTAVLALLLPVLVVALPVLDVAFALVRRLRRGRGLMEPDREHFHHRLLALHWTQREIVLLVYVITLLLSFVTLLLTFFKARV